MVAFLLSVGETLPRIENMVAFLLSVSVPGAEHFFLFFLFYLPCLFFSFLFSSVPGSVPEREHDHFFALWRRDLAPDWEHGRLFALCRRVGCGAFFSLFFYLFTLLSFFLACRARSRSGNMTAFLLSVGETWPRIGNMVAFWLSVGVSGSEHFFFSVSFFI